MTKEKVIDILKGIKDGTACLMPNMPEDGEKAIDIAIKAVEQSEPHWIPVTERFPEEYGTYLVTGEWESGDAVVGCCEYSVEDGYFQTARNFDVLAWMPLPELYKGVTDGRD